MLQPIVEEVSTWYMNQPETRRKVTNRLFSFPQQDDVYDSQIFPMHFEKSVGLSPFIDGVIKLQHRFSLQQEHCISVAYHTVTNESPFYFYRTVLDYLELDDGHEFMNVCSMSPVELGLDFHRRM